MEEERPLSGIAMNIIRGCLVVTIQTELYDDLVSRIQREILEAIHRQDSKRMIIDLSQVKLLDSFLAQAIFNTARMSSLIGARVVFCGLKPEVVASIVNLDINLRGIETSLNIEEAFRKLSAPD